MSGDGQPDEPERRRGRGEHGSAMVTALVLLFTFTAGAVVWLARDVDRRITNRSAAQSIAFQAARAGAQQIDIGSIRTGDQPAIDVRAARSAAVAAAAELGASYGFGEAQMAVVVEVVDHDGRQQVVVSVTVDDTAGSVTGVGAAGPRTEP